MCEYTNRQDVGFRCNAEYECVLTTEWAEQDVLVELGEHLRLRVIMTAWNCHSECRSEAWWWDSILISCHRVWPPVKYVYITQSRLNFCTWENSSAEGSGGDPQANLHLPLKLTTSQLAALFYLQVWILRSSSTYPGIINSKVLSWC